MRLCVGRQEGRAVRGAATDVQGRGGRHRRAHGRRLAGGRRRIRALLRTDRAQTRRVPKPTRRLGARKTHPVFFLLNCQETWKRRNIEEFVIRARVRVLSRKEEEKKSDARSTPARSQLARCAVVQHAVLAFAPGPRRLRRDSGRRRLRVDPRVDPPPLTPRLSRLERSTILRGETRAPRTLRRGAFSPSHICVPCQWGDLFPGTPC